MSESDPDTERALRSIIGSLTIEGSTLSDEDIARCRGVLEGKLDADEEVKKLAKKYSAIAKKQKNE